MKAVFIDDNIEYLNSIQGLCQLLDLQADIVCFVDAFEAMHYLTKFRLQIAAVFSDYNMNEYGVSGSIIVSKCKELDIPVYICTGYEKNVIEVNAPVFCKTDTQEMIEGLKSILQGRVAA